MSHARDAFSPPRSLSIVVPVFNELAYLPRVIERIQAVALPGGLTRRIIVIDDGSTDGTRELLERWRIERADLTILLHEHNRGKGAAIRTGLARADGDLVLIQDADLEYDPADYPVLLEPMLDGRADVVFGTRFLGGTHRVLYYWHAVGNRVLTMLSNMLTNVNLTDMECCYKVFRRDVLARLNLVEDGFGFEPEVTAKVAKLGVRLFEAPITYAGRTYAEGKKITFRDGMRALWCIWRYNLGR